MFVEKQTSECHLSKETKTMHIIQMVQEQHAIYFGYAVFRRFRLILQESKTFGLTVYTIFCVIIYIRCLAFLTWKALIEDCRSKVIIFK